MANTSSTNTHEEQIISLLKQNDQGVIKLIYEHYSQSLFNVIFRVLKDQNMAEDVFQEVMIKVWKKGHYFDRDKGSLYTWLLRVCKNAAIDKTRSKEFIKARNTHSPEELKVENSGRSEANHERVQEMLTHLPEKQKHIVDMAYFQGYTQEEIAKKLEIPLGTVKTRIRLALKHLRKIVNT